MKKIGTITFFVLALFLTITSCKNNESEKSFIKKIELNDETIAVGIYKATGYEYCNFKYVAEALNIDGGIVYVTLSDADVLKTKLENIDVVIFPSMKEGQEINIMDDEIAAIFKKFAATRGKGIIGICNRTCFLSDTTRHQSLGIMDIRIKKSEEGTFMPGLASFSLTGPGDKIFPELVDKENLYVNIQNPVEIELINKADSNITLVGVKNINGKSYPMFLNSTYGNGKIFITNTHPEMTPGMRWMIPRIVRWVFNKEFIAYEDNVFRPELYSSEIILTPELNAQIDTLLKIVETGNKSKKISAMDELQNLYPFIGIEKIKKLLYDKHDEVKLRAAKYLVDNECTIALDDLKKSIKKERSRKVRSKLKEYRNALESMMEQI